MEGRDGFIRYHSDLENQELSMAGVIGSLTTAKAYGYGKGTGANAGHDVTIHYEAIIVGAVYTEANFDTWWALRD